MTDILEILENGRVDWSDEHQTTTTIVTKNERLAIAEIKKLRARIAEQDYVLETIWRAEDRAARAWQAKTGEHLTWPDQAKLVEWLMDELHAARAALNGEKK